MKQLVIGPQGPQSTFVHVYLVAGLFLLVFISLTLYLQAGSFADWRLWALTWPSKLSASDSDYRICAVTVIDRKSSSTCCFYALYNGAP